jgi:protease I
VWSGSNWKSRGKKSRRPARIPTCSLHAGQIQARNNDVDEVGTFAVDREASDASVDDYDALLLPGGTVNPDKLRTEDRAVAFVRDVVGAGKPVGVICHGRGRSSRPVSPKAAH